MSETPSHAPGKSILPAWVKGPQDFIGGIALMALAAFALWASRDLQGMHGFSFGAGTAPRMFAVLLLVLGFGVMLTGILWEGASLQPFNWRGPLFVSLAIVAFAVAIRPLGLVFSAFVSFMVAALGTEETRWVEAIIVCVCLTTFCCVLFPYGLGLPMPLWPKFLNW